MNIDEYIPIGSNCSVAQNLISRKARTNAYPFDWQITSMKSFYTICLNDFDNLLEDIWIGNKIKRYYIADNIQNADLLDDYIYPVICKKYNILFPHYFKNTDKKSINSVKEKMQKRIKSFRTIIKNEKTKKYFVYKFGEELNEWQKSCYKSCGVDMNIFSKEVCIKYLNRAENLFSRTNVEFISLDQLK